MGRCYEIVKIPLDHICLKTGLLCPRCQALVDSGEVHRDEIPIMKVLVELEEDGSFRGLRNAKYVKSLRLKNLTVVVLKAKSLTPTELSKIAKRLGEALGSRVQVVEHTSDIKKMMAELVSPASITGVNMIWLPDGTTQYIVRISRYEEKLLPARRDVLEEALSKLLNAQVKIKVE